MFLFHSEKRSLDNADIWCRSPKVRPWKKDEAIHKVKATLIEAIWEAEIRKTTGSRPAQSSSWRDPPPISKITSKMD
jgi:hypothetical protein